jgi:hypothetical protein
VLDADAPPGQRDDKFLFTFDAPVRWPGTIVWKYNPAGAPAAFTDASATVARLTSALDKWSAVCAISHSYQGSTATAPDNRPGGQPDLANVVGWGALQGSTAGLTWTWYSSPGGVPQLIDGDIILSPAQVTSNAQMDRVAMHEWGHLIGLAHSNMNQTAMSGPPYSSYNNIVVPTDDDVRGCRCLYGPAAGQSAGLLCSLPRTLAFGNVAAGASSAPTTVDARQRRQRVAHGANADVHVRRLHRERLRRHDDRAGPGVRAVGVVRADGADGVRRHDVDPGRGRVAALPHRALGHRHHAFEPHAVAVAVDRGVRKPDRVHDERGEDARAVQRRQRHLLGHGPHARRRRRADFNRAGTCAIGTTLGAAATCSIVLTFSPLAVGTRSATLDVALSSGSVPAVALSGTGTASPLPPALSVSTAALSFANQVAGTQSASQNVTVANTGGGTLTVISASLAGAAPADFALGGNCTAGRALSTSQSCTASVRFAPAGPGAKSATLAIATSAGNASVALAGNALAPPTVTASTVVEYYHAAYDHYFITIGTEEIAALDTGAFAGWTRTGLSFKAHASAQSGFVPICRFYLPPGYRDSHFYSASPAECAIVHADNPAFVLESTAVMYLATPDPVSGACPGAHRSGLSRVEPSPRRHQSPLHRVARDSRRDGGAGVRRRGQRARRRDVLRAALTVRRHSATNIRVVSSTPTPI